MSKYFINADGTFHAISNRNLSAINPELQEVPVLPDDGLTQIWNGEAWEDKPDLRDYREKRKEAYATLGDDATGDFIDDLAKALDGNALIAGTDLQARIDKFNRVKAAFPKEDVLTPI